MPLGCPLKSRTRLLCRSRCKEHTAHKQSQPSVWAREQQQRRGLASLSQAESGRVLVELSGHRGAGRCASMHSGLRAPQLPCGILLCRPPRTRHRNCVEVAVVAAALAQLHVALKACQLLAAGRKAGAQRRKVPAGFELR